MRHRKTALLKSMFLEHWNVQKIYVNSYIYPHRNKFFQYGSQYISKECIDRNNYSNIIKTNKYYKTFKNYTHTKWSEASNWGEEHTISQ